MKSFGTKLKPHFRLLSKSLEDLGNSTQEMEHSTDPKLISKSTTHLKELINVEQFNLISSFQLDLIYNTRLKKKLRRKRKKQKKVIKWS
jgi:hypothetical protein